MSCIRTNRPLGMEHILVVQRQSGELPLELLQPPFQNSTFLIAFAASSSRSASRCRLDTTVHFSMCSAAWRAFPLLAALVAVNATQRACMSVGGAAALRTRRFFFATFDCLVYGLA